MCLDIHAKFRGDRPLRGRDLKGGSNWPPPPVKNLLSKSPVNPKTAGGGLNQPPPSTFSATIPPREIFWPRRSLTFYFQVSRILWHHFRENRAYRYDATRPFIQARQTKNGSKTWFCVQSQCKWSFLTLFIKIWLFSLSLAEINSF